MLKKINEQKCVLWFVFPSKRFGSGPSLVKLQVKEMKWTLTYSFPCMISYWRCIPETVKLSPYVIFSYFSVFFVRSFVCIAQYIVEQCNNDWKRLNVSLALENHCCEFVLCDIALRIFTTYFANVLIPDVPFNCSFNYPIAPIFLV